MNRGRLHAVLLAAALAGCGSNLPTATPDGSTQITDVSGWYQVTSDMAGPCGATTAAPLPISYVWMQRLQNTFYFKVCSGPTEAECTGSLFYDFVSPIPNGLSAEGGIASFGAACVLTWERTQLTLIGDQLMANSLKYSVTDTRAQEQCTLEAASMIKDPDNCTYQHDITATRLAAAAQ